MTIRSGASVALALSFLVACRSSRQEPPPPSVRVAQAPAPSAPPPSSAPAPAPAPEPPPPSEPVATAPAPLEDPPVVVSAPPAQSVPAQPPSYGAPANRPYMDILKLKQAGLSDDFLLNKIRTENVNYQLTTSEILELRSVGVSERVLEAMMRSGQPAGANPGTPVARQAEFSGLARVSKGFLGVFGTSTKHIGRLVVDGEKVSWYETEDPDKNFSVYLRNVKEIFNTCVLRPGQNLCLEIGFVTYTDEEYRFREPGWKKGDNRAVTEATNYFRQAFPNLFFSQRAVNEM